MGTLAKSEQKMKDAQGQHKSNLKKFKLDGGDSTILKTAQRIAKLTPRERREEFAVLNWYLDAVDPGAGEQLELLDQIPARTENQLLQAAFDQGYLAMNEGFSTDENLHESGIPLHEKWLDGHAKAIKDGEEAFTSDDDEQGGEGEVDRANYRYRPAHRI